MANETKHTPGPWTQDADTGRVLIPSARGATIIAEIPVDAKAHRANARLIAAAPDLLAAAKFAMRFENFGVAGLIKLRAAIAKAEAGS